MAEDLRTRVRFPPPPPLKQNGVYLKGCTPFVLWESGEDENPRWVDEQRQERCRTPRSGGPQGEGQGWPEYSRRLHQSQKGHLRVAFCDWMPIAGITNLRSGFDEQRQERCQTPRSGGLQGEGQGWPEYSRRLQNIERQGIGAHFFVI